MLIGVTDLLLETLARFGGVASTAALAEHGLTARRIDRGVQTGDLLRLRQGWVALPSAPNPVVRAVRVGGRLSCVSALHPRKIWCRESRGLHVRVGRYSQHLSAPHDRRVPLGAPARFGVTVHRTITPGLAEHPFAIDPVPHALMHAVKCQPPADAIATLDSALNRKLITWGETEELLSFLPQRYRRYLQLVDGKSQSGLETKARLACRRHRIPFRTQVSIDGVGYVDILIGERLVLELDGYEFHSSKADFEEDRRRDAELARQCFRVQRASHDQVMYRWDEVFTVVRQLVARGEHRWSAVERRFRAR